MPRLCSTSRGWLAAFLSLSLLLAACGDDAPSPPDATGTDSGARDDVAADAGDEDDDAPFGEDGGYEYASDVSSHRLVVEDMCEVNSLLDADPIDFDAVSAIYVDGKHSANSDGSVRTFAGFTTATDRLHGYDEYYDSDTPLDDFVTAAIEGTDEFEGESDAVRRQGVQKGIQNQTMIAWVIHELNAALAKADDGNFDADEGAPHNWDEAWAFYHGSAPDCAPYATADKRGADFGTLAAAGETSRANEAVLQAMNEGRDALLAEDAGGAEAATDEVLRQFVITYAQATIKYAALVSEDLEADDAEKAREHQAEGYAFFRVMEPTLADAGADVDTIDAVLSLENEPGANGGEEEVRTALQPAFDALGISAEDIGQLG
ncbi:MAG TPA: FEA1-related lipoprotein [Acidimicrobiales bacterium]|nr:FEA1-related lipoprotein [Acidimicrobiales bacterium]